MKFVRKFSMLLVILILTSACGNRQVFDANFDFYDSMSNVSWRSGMGYDDEKDDLIFVDIERQEIFHLNLGQESKIVSIGTSIFVDGKKPIDSNHTFDKYIEEIKSGLIFRSNDKMFMMINRIDNSGSSKEHFSVANLDGSNIKSLIQLDELVNEYVMGSGLIVFSSYPNDFKNTTTLKVYDNNLKFINTIEIDGFAPDLQIYDDNIFVSLQSDIPQSLQINPLNGDITEIGLPGYSIRVVNDGYYILDIPTEFDEDGLAVNFMNKVYNADDHSEVFTLENQIAYLIKDDYIITSSVNGDRTFARYSLSGEKIDELKPTDYLHKDLMDVEYIKSHLNFNRSYHETDLITMPFRYGNDKVIARILSSDSGPFVICDFKSKDCQLIEY